jgi:biotin transport system substrate-specific component
LLGPTGGYLIAYPVVAFIAGFIAERGKKSFTRSLLAATVAEVVLFASGISWLAVMTHTPILRAASFGLYPFVFAEVMKVMASAGISSRISRRF